MRPREEEDGFDHCVRRPSNDLCEHVEMGSCAGRNDRKDEKYCDHDNDAVPLESSERRRQRVWQHPHSDAPAVERWQRNQVENCEKHIELDGVHEIREQPLAGSRRQESDRMQEQGGYRGHEKIHAGPGGGDPDHVAPRVPQALEPHGYRFGVAEQERSVREDQNCRKRDCAEGIDVFQRVERHTPELPGGIVSKALGNVPVRRLVQRDGEQRGNDPG